MGAIESEHECTNCEETNYVHEDHELYCPRCGATPFYSHQRRETAWENFQRVQAAKVAGGDRPRMVGGWHNAYWGEGSYEFNPTDGFSL